MKSLTSGFPANVLYIDHARFTLLTSRMYRIEWSEDGVFEDRPTLQVVNRRTPRVSYQVLKTARSLRIRTKQDGPDTLGTRTSSRIRKVC